MQSSGSSVLRTFLVLLSRSWSSLTEQSTAAGLEHRKTRFYGLETKTRWENAARNDKNRNQTGWANRSAETNILPSRGAKPTPRFAARAVTSLAVAPEPRSQPGQGNKPASQPASLLFCTSTTRPSYRARKHSGLDHVLADCVNGKRFNGKRQETWKQSWRLKSLPFSFSLHSKVRNEADTPTYRNNAS